MQSSLRTGDLLFIYVAKPLHQFAWVGRALSDAERPKAGTGHWTAWLELQPLAEPLGLDQARRDPALADWTLVRAGGLQGSTRRVKQPDWDALVATMVGRNPGLAVTLEAWRTPPEPETESSYFAWDAARAGVRYPFVRERELQEWMKQTLESGEDMREPTDDDAPGLQAFESRLGDENRADIILVDENHEPPRLVVVETKLFARDDAALRQLERYRGWLAENHPHWELELLVAAQVVTPRVRAAAREASVSCVEVRWTEEEDSFLPGDGELTLDWSEPAHEIVVDEVEIARRTRAAIEALGAPDARTTLEIARAADVPSAPGVIALWVDPEDETAWSDLGVPSSYAGRPLITLACLHLDEALLTLGTPDAPLPGFLRHHLTLVRRVLPRPLHSGSHADERAERDLAAWAEQHLRVSWTATPGLMPSGVTRVARSVFDPIFTLYGRSGIDVLLDRFGEIGLEIDRMRWSLDWEAWAAFALEGTLLAPPPRGVHVAVDGALRPIGLLDELSTAEREGMATAVLEPPLWSDTARQLKEAPPRDRLDEVGRPPKGWAATVDLLDPLAVLVLRIGERIRSMSVACDDGDGMLLLKEPPGNLISLPGGDPTDDQRFVFIDGDGFRHVETLSADPG